MIGTIGSTPLILITLQCYLPSHCHIVHVLRPGGAYNNRLIRSIFQPYGPDLLRVQNGRHDLALLYHVLHCTMYGYTALHALCAAHVTCRRHARNNHYTLMVCSSFFTCPPQAAEQGDPFRGPRQILTIDDAVPYLSEILNCQAAHHRHLAARHQKASSSAGRLRADLPRGSGPPLSLFGSRRDGRGA